MSLVEMKMMPMTRTSGDEKIEIVQNAAAFASSNFSNNKVGVYQNNRRIPALL